MASKEPFVASSRLWFRNSSTNQINSKSLKPAKVAVDGHEAFKARFRRLFRQENINDQIQESEAGVLQQLNGFKEIVGDELQGADAKKNDWMQKRYAGSRKFGTYLQKALTSFSAFLESYSGIVEVVKSAGAPYGEAAYGTLSLLFIVAFHKSTNEEKIINALEELQNLFPRVHLATDIYPEERIEKFVAALYKEVIDFARESTEYFAHSSIRLRNAVTKTSQSSVDVSLEKIHRRLAEVNAETSILLHQNVSRILVANTDLQNRLASVQSELQNMRIENTENQKRENEEKLEAFRIFLGVPEACDNTDIEKCKQGLCEAFLAPNSNQRRLAKWSRMTQELLEAQETYQRWLKCDHSNFLVLGGKTAPEGQSQVCMSTYSWLSPAMIFMFEKLRVENKQVLYYCCHPQLRAKTIPLRDVVLNLLYQAAALKPEMLQHRRQHFEVSIGKEVWCQANRKEMLKKSFRVLNEMLELTGPETVYIIIDRADQCEGKLYHLLESLLALTRNVTCTLKIAVLMDSAFWNVDLDDFKDLQERARNFMESRLDWDQMKESTSPMPK